MGTNFYARTTGPVTCEHCGQTNQFGEIDFHLGKRSGGWPFLRHADPSWPRGEAYEQWIAAMRDALKAGGRIVDEYGQPWTPDELIREADEWDQRGRIHELFDGQWIDANGRRWDAAEFS